MSDLHYIEKEKKTVNGQYRFVSHDAVVAKVQKMLVKHRVTTASCLAEMQQDGNCTRVKLNTTFFNVDNPSDCFTVQFPGYGIDGGDKGPGKAISYAYKYALLKTFNLETGEDPDYDAKASYEPPRCLEFDSILPIGFTDKDKEKMDKFLSITASNTGRNVEEIKREAVKRSEEFMKAFTAWKPKKGE